MNRHQNLFLIVAVLVGIALAAVFWLNRGYGEVSPQTYEFSKAIYSACLNKNGEQLDKVEELLTNQEGLPANERSWLDSIIESARGGDWETASRNARRMMEDQVQY